MEKNEQGSFTCYNCGQKNYFDKQKYLKGTKSTGSAVEVTVECQHCREINNVVIKL
jgi:hypothetical protein